MDDTLVVDVLGPRGKLDAATVLIDSREIDLVVFPFRPAAVGMVAPVEIGLDFGRFDEKDYMRSIEWAD